MCVFFGNLHEFTGLFVAFCRARSFLNQNTVCRMPYDFRPNPKPSTLNPKPQIQGGCEANVCHARRLFRFNGKQRKPEVGAETLNLEP